MSTRSRHSTGDGCAVALAFAAGAVDAIGFVALGRVFLAHVTGNFVLLGAGLGGAIDGTELGSQLVVLPAFVCGVALGHRAPSDAQCRAARLAGTEAILLGAATGLLLFVPEGAIGVFVVVGVAAAAMGLQAVLTRQLALPMTNVMTGNVVALTLGLLERRRATAPAAPSVGALVRMVLAFLAGALTGAWSGGSLGSVALALPALVVAGVAMRLRQSAPSRRPIVDRAANR